MQINDKIVWNRFYYINYGPYYFTIKKFFFYIGL